VISKNPTVKAVKALLEEQEAKFDFTILDKVIYDARLMDIRDIEKESQQQAPEVEQVDAVQEDAIVLDIRSPEEEDDAPLELDGIEVMT
ncbi:hypothetical protein, partial [Bacillus cereus group sp. Bce013]